MAADAQSVEGVWTPSWHAAQPGMTAELPAGRVVWITETSAGWHVTALLPEAQVLVEMCAAGSVRTPPGLVLWTARPVGWQAACRHDTVGGMSGAGDAGVWHAQQSFAGGPPTGATAWIGRTVAPGWHSGSWQTELASTDVTVWNAAKLTWTTLKSPWQVSQLARPPTGSAIPAAIAATTSGRVELWHSEQPSLWIVSAFEPWHEGTVHAVGFVLVEAMMSVVMWIDAACGPAGPWHATTRQLLDGVVVAEWQTPQPGGVG